MAATEAGTTYFETAYFEAAPFFGGFIDSTGSNLASLLRILARRPSWNDCG